MKFPRWCADQGSIRTFRFAPPLFFPNAPCTTTGGTLAAAHSEPNDLRLTTGGFRVVCIHTREFSLNKSSMPHHVCIFFKEYQPNFRDNPSHEYEKIECLRAYASCRRYERTKRQRRARRRGGEGQRVRRMRRRSAARTRCSSMPKWCAISCHTVSRTMAFASSASRAAARIGSIKIVILSGKTQ